MNGRKWRGPVRSKARRPYGRRQWAHRHGASRRCGVEPVIAGVAANAPGLLQGVSSEWDSGSHPDAGARRCESREPRSVGNWCERGQPDSRRPIRIAICEGFSADTQRSRHASHNNVLEPGRDPLVRVESGRAKLSHHGGVGQHFHALKLPENADDRFVRRKPSGVKKIPQARAELARVCPDGSCREPVPDGSPGAIAYSHCHAQREFTPERPCWSSRPT